jgi:hypothetical protein
MKIAFGYGMRVGKDTAANYMMKQVGGKKLSFAHDLYDILHYAQDKCGFKKEKDRKFLQFIGTEWARSIDTNVWIKSVLDKSSGTGNFYVSDLRFKNEFDALKANGWTCVKIIRNDNFVKDSSSSETSHISETELDSLSDHEWDHIIVNNGTDSYFDELRKLYK